MEPEAIKSLFDDKYKKLLNMSYEEWLETGPQTEEQAYARCIEIDRTLNQTYDQWFEAKDVEKDQLGDYRDKLKVEYDLIEDIFHLEANDRNW